MDYKICEIGGGYAENIGDLLSNCTTDEAHASLKYLLTAIHCVESQMAAAKLFCPKSHTSRRRIINKREHLLRDHQRVESWLRAANSDMTAA